MIEKREASPTTLLSSTSDIEILNPMIPNDEFSSKTESNFFSSGMSTNPLAKLAAACTSLCNEMKPKSVATCYSNAAHVSSHAHMTHPTVSSVSPLESGMKPSSRLLPSNFLSTLPNVLSALQVQQQNGTQQLASLDSINYLLPTAATSSQDLFNVKQQQQPNSSATQNIQTQGLSTLEALQSLHQKSPLGGAYQTSQQSSLDYITKLYLQAATAKKAQEIQQLLTYNSGLQDLVSAASAASEKSFLSTTPSSNGLHLQNGLHLHNGLDYRVCPCTSCQTLRLSVLAAQQQMNQQQVTTSRQLPIQQHYLLPHKNALTGIVQYLPVCPDPSNCSLCTKTVSSESNHSQTVKSGSASVNSLNQTHFLSEQYFSAITSQNQHTQKSANLTSPTSSLENNTPTSESPDYSLPLQIQTTPSPKSSGENFNCDITCSWTENGAPCGHKFISEEQLFDHIRKCHTSVSNMKLQSSPATSEKNLECEPKSNPLASLTNLSRKVLPELNKPRYHPYARSTVTDSSRLISTSNQCTTTDSRLSSASNQFLSSRPSTLPSSLLSSGLTTSYIPAVLSGFPNVSLPFSLSTSNNAGQYVSANQMSSLLFAAAR